MRLPRTTTLLAIAGLSFIAAIVVWWCQPTEEEILKRCGLEGSFAVFCEEEHYKLANEWISKNGNDFPKWLQKLLANRFKNKIYNLNNAPALFKPSLDNIASALPHIRLNRASLHMPIGPGISKALKQQRQLIEVSVFDQRTASDCREDLGFLQYQTALEIYRFAGRSDQGKAYSLLQSSHKLEILILHVPGNTTQSVDAWPKLKTLSLSSDHLNDTCFDSLLHCPELTELELYSVELCGRKKPIQLPRKLTKFSLWTPGQAGIFLESLAKSCPDLLELSLDCELSGDDCLSLIQFSHLKKLTVGGEMDVARCSITWNPEVLLQLKLPASLETLEFNRIQIPANLLPVLAAKLAPGRKIRVICADSGLSAADFAPWPQLVPNFK